MWQDIQDLLVAILLLALGLTGTVWAGRVVVKIVHTRSWEETRCEAMLGVGSPRHRIRGTFSYTYRGRDYRSNEIALVELEFSELGGADSYIGRVLRKDGLTCLVNPDRPDEAVLMRTKHGLATAGYWFTLLIGLAFCLLGLGVLVRCACRLPGRLRTP